MADFNELKNLSQALIILLDLFWSPLVECILLRALKQIVKLSVKLIQLGKTGYKAL